MRRKIAAGNWKMNLTYSEAKLLINSLSSMEIPHDVEVIIAPPSCYLEYAVQALGKSSILVAAQNCYIKPFGAFTGEISAKQLASMGVNHVIIGHSERRQFFSESGQMLADKVKTALDAGVRPIYCCGEILSDRKAGNHFDVVCEQIKNGLFELEKELMLKCIIAYEPVWAIGTGETATPAQAQEMHSHIRAQITVTYGAETAMEIPILYGGSVKPSNARELFSQSDVDGGLVGGASLIAADFLDIIRVFQA